MANKIEVTTTLRDDLTARMEKVGATVQKSSRDVLTAAPAFAALEAAIAGAAAAAVLIPIRYSEVAESLGKLRAATGLSYRELQALRQALVEAGTAPEALNTATRILNVNLAQGDKTLAKYGVTAKTTYAAILQIGQIMANTGDSTKRSELAMAAFGRSSQDLIETIIKFSTDPNYRKALESIGISDEGIAKLQKTDEALDRLKRSWQGLTNTFAEMGAGPAAAGINLLNGLMRALGNTRFIGGAIIPGDMRDLNELARKTRKMGEIVVEGAEVTAEKFAGPGPLDFVRGYRPGFMPSPAWRPTYATSPSGWNRMLARSVSGEVDQPLNTWDEAQKKALARNQQMVAQMAAGVTRGFETMFDSIFMIQRRSKNVVVSLFVDLYNSIVSSIASRAGSAIGGFFIDTVLSAIPGLGFLKGGSGKATASTVINYNAITAPNLSASAINPTGAILQANRYLYQRARIQ